MYCKNCGSEMADVAAVCVKCGTAKGQGNAFCQNCGHETAPGAAFCLNCGAPTADQQVVVVPEGYTPRSKMAAGLLGIFLGALGIHNFYLGYTGKAIAQLLITVCTCGVGGVVSEIWGLVEGIQILTGSIAVDAKGVPLKE